jgi:[methyl-Co(III) methanol/glycine betaine-specific corrinoid protein]:coenzyme M methyltransferase
MSELTQKERVQRLFRREPIDTMPIFSGMGMVTIHAIKKMGIRFASVHTTAENLAASARTTAEMYGFDAAIVPYDMCTVPEALGRGISLYADSEDILYPTVPTKWTTLDEVDLDKNFLNNARMPAVDGAFNILKGPESENLALGAWLLGPFTMAGQVIELDVLLKGTKKNKDKVEAFLTDMTDLVIKAAKHYESLGVDYITIREMGSGTDLLSPRMWKTLIGPNLTRVFDAISIPTNNHICGSTDLIVEMMNDCGADSISVDQKNNVVETRKKLGDDVLIFGNFDPYGTLVQMEAAEVAPVIKKCIDDGVDAIWPGCDIWPDVKQENMTAYVETIREYGRQPTPAVGRL